MFFLGDANHNNNPAHRHDSVNSRNSNSNSNNRTAETREQQLLSAALYRTGDLPEGKGHGDNLPQDEIVIEDDEEEDEEEEEDQPGVGGGR